MADPLTYAIVSGVSSTVSYLGAREEANQLEENADAVQTAAQYNSRVELNNGIGRFQDKKFQSSVALANIGLLNQQHDLKNRNELKTFKKNYAEVVSRNPRVSLDVLDALEQEAFDAIKSGNSEYVSQVSSLSAQATEYDRQAEVELMNSRASSTNILYQGANEARGLRAQASNKRFSAGAQLLGSFAMTGMNYQQLKG